jgi:UDP-N-acetylmuramoyl-tripeptide--D-alanyl-D-alanine ligase
VQALPADGVAILNADDERVRAIRSLTDASVLLFGESSDADVRAVDVRLDDLARASFTVVSPWGEVPVRLAISGRHMVPNAAAALAVVGAVGADIAAGAAALADAGLSAMRMEIVRTPSGATVLNDAYNANPTSMRAALEALAALPATRRLAVVGVMAEISDAPEAHLAIANHARALGIELVAVGTDLYGPAPSDDPVGALGSLSGGDAVLVKGSRVVGLERVVAQLLL